MPAAATEAGRLKKPWLCSLWNLEIPPIPLKNHGTNALPAYWVALCARDEINP
jgi:hypothetical protein